MPVYEYRCEACGHLTEAIRRMHNADAPLVCEACGSKETRRVHSVFSTGSSSASQADASSGGACGHCGLPGGSCGLPPQ